MTENFQKGLDQADMEYRYAYSQTKFIKKTAERVSATNMKMMRARDIEREKDKPETGYVEFCFTVTTYNPEFQKWDACPGCGNDDINKTADNGHKYQECFKCHILLGSNGTIKSMNPNRKKKKEEKESEPEPEFKTADQLMGEPEKKQKEMKE